MGRPQVNGTRDEAIRALHAAGRTCTEIADDYGITRTRVSQIVNRGRPPQRRAGGRPAVNTERDEQIRYAWRFSTVTAREIGERYGVTSARVHQVCRGIDRTPA